MAFVRILSELKFKSEQDRDPDFLIPDTGPEEVEINCDPSHLLKLVAQQGLSREGWEGTID